LKCLELILIIDRAAGVPTLAVDSTNVDEGSITPSEVYDIASSIVARLELLHEHYGLEGKPRKVFYPGRKEPSEVYQRVGILEAQLRSWEQLIGTRDLTIVAEAKR
jgi:hypothetical protein